MPDYLGYLNDEEMARGLDWVTRAWGKKRACPMHPGVTNWILGNTLVRIGENRPVGSPGPHSTFYPLLALTCSTCGYTAFVNAILAGVVSGDTNAPVTYGE